MNRRKRLYALVLAPVVVGIAATAAITIAPSASAASREEFCRFTLEFMADIPNYDGNGDGLVGWSTVNNAEFTPWARYFKYNDTNAWPYIETAGRAAGNNPDGLASWNDGNAAFNKQCLNM
jgi:hypothetical protein